MMVPAFSFAEVAQALRHMMPDGGALLTLSYIGAQQISPNYNVMGVARLRLKVRSAIWRSISATRTSGSTRCRPAR